ncbi:hypothetical protein EB118_23005, partial [bacterium]|nr:hypothetical protein [bacterium]
TNLKYYIERGGTYYDITPIRSVVTLGANPFTGNGTTTVVVTATAHGAITNDFVTFSGVTGTYASLLNAEYQIVYIDANSYSITTASVVAAGATGGSAVVATYQINTGPAIQVPFFGWGAGPWGLGTWGNGLSTTVDIRLWSANNFGEDLVFGPRGGALYYWSATSGVNTRGVNVNTLGGTVTLTIASPCVITLSNILAEGTAIKLATTGALPTGLTAGTTYYLRNVNGATANLSSTLTGSAINTSGSQSGIAGSLRLSHGSQIVGAIQARQEIVVFTDSSIYSLQYLGPPYVWGSQLLGDNISILSQNAAMIASGKIYWMGIDKFYVYDGRVQTLRCDLRRHVFGNINLSQNQQVLSGTIEAFNEVWWFYCTANSTVIDAYVVYNYAEDIWYYGSMARTAWLDSGLRDYPVAATYSNNLVNHEYGVDDNTSGTAIPIEAYIESAEFDIDDGEHFGFVWRMVPDLTFQGSTAATPQVTMTMYGMNGSGSGYNTEAAKSVARTSTAVIEQFTNIIYTRIRGRQMIIEISSDGLGTTWQLGAPRIDIRQDGRR